MAYRSAVRGCTYKHYQLLAPCLLIASWNSLTATAAASLSPLLSWSSMRCPTRLRTPHMRIRPNRPFGSFLRRAGGSVRSSAILSTLRTTAAATALGETSRHLAVLSLLPPNPSFLADGKAAGLFPLYMNPHVNKFTTRKVSFGAMGDSFYEYLLKARPDGAS